MTYLTPAQYLIHTFLGLRRAARAVGIDPSNLCRWAQRPEGYIPAQVQLKVIKAAKERGVELTSDDIIYGKMIEDDNG